ncbi:DUF5994 family protein [Cellulomonas chengniuliangii]|uniref:DUF5994 family protein n=1 Tax=Cellulomonas chengniuliangii TaxID=2968084 RepID=A0ABY5KXE8_9CELL|nr:DUF5994 family protein [Cellulomonas chengniuliangii]MCC2308912.1 DUF5994 family protein [Cellulomonas chengniuliangii]MCC2319439.1 DUF5994 family protein [Cellulomonas chengniuliangii]UUI74349.1 DUF5994 family protein [Cellulomonas chengniuliangii]
MSISSLARPRPHHRVTAASPRVHPESWFGAVQPVPEAVVRLEIAPEATEGPVQGAWWPWSRDLAVQAPALLSAVGSACGTSVVHLVYDRLSWDPVPHRLPLGDRYVKTGWFDLADPHQVSLHLYGGRRLVLLVVPPEAGRRTALRAMHQAADRHNRLTPGQILPR